MQPNIINFYGKRIHIFMELVHVRVRMQIMRYPSMSSNNFEWEPRVIRATHFVSASQHEGKFAIILSDIEEMYTRFLYFYLQKKFLKLNQLPNSWCLFISVWMPRLCPSYLLWIFRKQNSYLLEISNSVSQAVLKQNYPQNIATRNEFRRP